MADRKECGRAGTIIIFCVALVVAAAVAWAAGIFGDITFVVGEDGVGVEHVDAGDVEAAIVDELEAVVAAQKAYHDAHGAYSPSLMGLATVDPDLNAATCSHPAVPNDELDRPELMMLYKGYYFTQPETQGPGVVDWTTGFVAVAEPRIYEPGTPTYAVGPTGTVLKKDAGGERITDVGRIDGSWKPAD